MQKSRSRANLVVVAGLIFLAACDTGHVSLPVRVIVPTDVQTVSSGILRLSLWIYDPLLADAPATLGDADSVRFVHQTGTTTTFRMHVSADIPGGQKYYITVRGFEFSASCEKYILWDGLEGPTVSLRVVMRPVSNPTCVP
jgi:hypothetical protein